ncbi:hypothetical protein EBZ80_14560 [bacterium]|nr:hypothetical protein [bacterium]
MQYRTILICSGGKTGTSTLVKSTARYLQDRNLDISMVGATHARHTSEIVQDCRAVATPQERLLILTSFRDPVTRMIASFFENIDQHVGNVACGPSLPFPEMLLASMCKMDQYLDPTNPVYLEAYHPVGPPPSDVKDFLITHEEPVDIVWLRLDRAHLWESQIGQVLPGWTMLSDNLSVEKPYHHLYETFRQLYWNPHFHHLIDCERHIWEKYLSPFDMDAIRRRWCGPPSCISLPVRQVTLLATGTLSLTTTTCQEADLPPHDDV